jgi:hypothetical protein
VIDRQEAPVVDAEDNTDYLRFGNVKFNYQLLKLRYSGNILTEATHHSINLTSKKIKMVGCHTIAEIIPIRRKCGCVWTPREMLDG